MSDKPQSVPDPFPALPGHRILTLSGPDAESFAQAQFMNDASALAEGQWQWNGWLTPKGRVIALFALLRIDARSFWLLLPDADPGALAERLQRFVFRSKLVLEVATGLSVSGGFVAPTSARGAQAAQMDDGGMELDMGGDGGPRTLRIGNATDTGEDGAARWREADIMHGLPRLGDAQAEQWTPQQLSLDRLKAFSVRKGCYPGQEIVARTHFLGKAKRGLACFRSAAPMVDGSEIGDGERAIGTVVSVSADGKRCLAVIPLDSVHSGATVGAGARLEAEAMLGGLAR